MSFHEYNPFSGRLKQATQTQPLYPLSPRPLQSTEPPVMIYDTVKTKPATTKVVAKASYSTLSPKLAKLYKKYQADMEKPSYLLAGKRDKFLFAFTAAWTAINTVASLYLVVKCSK